MGPFDRKEQEGYIDTKERLNQSKIILGVIVEIQIR
jgi:hypothetical protein